MEIILRQALLTVIIPAVVSGVFALVFARWLKAWTAPLALSLGFLSGYVILQGFPAFPPNTVLQAIPYLLIAALIYSAVEQVLPKGILLLPRLIVLALPLWPLLASKRTGSRFAPADWNTGESIAYSVVLLMCALLFWWALSRQHEHEKDQRALPSIMLLVSSASAVMALLSSSATSAQMTGVLTAGIGALWLLSLFDVTKVSEHLIAVTTVLLSFLWVNVIVVTTVGNSFLGFLPLLLLAASPLLLAMPRFNQKSWTSLLIRTAMIAAPLVIAIGIAFLQNLQRYG